MGLVQPRRALRQALRPGRPRARPLPLLVPRVVLLPSGLRLRRLGFLRHPTLRVILLGRHARLVLLDPGQERLPRYRVPLARQGPLRELPSPPRLPQRLAQHVKGVDLREGPAGDVGQSIGVQLHEGVREPAQGLPLALSRQERQPQHHHLVRNGLEGAENAPEVALIRVRELVQLEEALAQNEGEANRSAGSELVAHHRVQCREGGVPRATKVPQQQPVLGTLLGREVAVGRTFPEVHRHLARRRLLRRQQFVRHPDPTQPQSGVHRRALVPSPPLSLSH